MNCELYPITAQLIIRTVSCSITAIIAAAAAVAGLMKIFIHHIIVIAVVIK